MIDSFERLSSHSVSTIYAGQPVVQLTPSLRAPSTSKRNQRFHTSQVAGTSREKDPESTRHLNLQANTDVDKTPPATNVIPISPNERLYNYCTQINQDLSDNNHSNTAIRRLTLNYMTRPPTEFLAIMDEFLANTFGITAPKKNTTNQGGRVRHYGSTRGGVGRRASNYKRAQDLFVKNKKTLMAMILNDTFSDADDHELPPI